MTLRTRRILFFIALLFFFTVTPILIEYARGLRFDFSTWKFVETGGFFFKIHSPTETKILLDGKPIKTTSAFSYFNNAFIQNLAPGYYDIEISRDEYQPWNKKLKIEPQFVTEARDVVLVPDNLQLGLYSAPNQKIKKVYQSQNKKYLAIIKYTEKNQTMVEILDLSSRKSSEILASKYIVVLDLIDWDSISGKLLFYDNDKNDYIIVSVPDGKIKSIGTALSSNKIAAKNIKDAKIGSQDNIFILISGSLYVFDSALQSLALLKKDVSAIKTNGDVIYYLSGADFSLTRSYFKNKSLIFEQTIGAIDSDNKDAEFILDIDESGNIFALEKKSKALFMLSAENDRRFIKIDEGVGKFSPSKDGNKILYQKQNKLIAYYPKDIKIQPYKYADQKEILTSAPQKILSSQWFETNEHVFYSFENSIKFIELDDRDHQNIFHIAETTNPEIFYDDANNILYALSNEKLYALAF